MRKDPDIIEIIMDDTPDEQIAADAEENTFNSRVSGLFAGISKKYLVISCCICAAVIIGAFAAGIAVTKSDAAVTRNLVTLQNSNKTYTEAKSENEGASKELEAMKKELEEKQESLGEITESRESLEKITAENEELKKEEQQLKSSVASKQSELEELEKSVNKYEKSSYVWSSGTYTVGKNIAAGEYTVTGSGSIVISNNGSARVNTRLKSDGVKYTLKDGDIIKIDGSARLTAE